MPSLDCGCFFLKFLYTDSPDFEIGIIVTKKVGNAVLRNFVKRRVRNGIRLALRQANILHNIRIIVIAKKELKDVAFKQLVGSMVYGLTHRPNKTMHAREDSNS